METTILGRTGLEVSRLGVGLAEIGSLEDSGEAGRVLNEALDAGINFLDTAECYGRSEEFLGRNVSHRRSEFALATKAGHVHGPDPFDGEPWTGATVTGTIERSLKRLKTDYVDLVQLHAFDVPTPPPDDVVEALLKARDAGKTRFVGYSQENEEAEWAIDSGIFDTLQTTFNLVDQKARHNIFDRARAQGVGIIVKRPIANAVWGSSKSPAEYEGVRVLFAERAQAISAMGPIPGEPDDPIATALGFVLAHADSHTAIVGTRNPAHMLENIRVVETQLPIPGSVVEELRRRYDEIGMDWVGLDVVR
jgi:aryl-alcohol dehydrogenase-like predicted oxidoreductase